MLSTIRLVTTAQRIRSCVKPLTYAAFLTVNLLVQPIMAQTPQAISGYNGSI